MAKSGCFGMIQFYDLRTLKIDLDLPKFWPYWHLKCPKFENETPENIVISSWWRLTGDIKRTFVVVQSRNFDKHCLHTAKWIWDSSIFSRIKPKIDIGLFVDFCIFTCFYQFLHDVIIILFCRSKQNNFMITSW